jgi:hypothetical protein
MANKIRVVIQKPVESTSIGANIEGGNSQSIYLQSQIIDGGDSI